MVFSGSVGTPEHCFVGLWLCLAMSLILSELAVALLGASPAWRGDSWLGCQDLPGMGAVFI